MIDDDTPIDLPPETDDDSEDIDVERAALEAAGIDVSGSRARGPGRPNAILEALEHLGPSSATEIASTINRATGNVSTRLRQMEEEDRVHRTGKSVNAGARGGPQIEWAIGPSPNGQPTGPGTQVEQPVERGSFEGRLRAMAEKVAFANGRVEALEHERDGATERARRSEAAQREAERQRDEARRRIEGLQLTLRELEANREQAVNASELEEALEAEKQMTRELVEKVELLERQRSDLEKHVEQVELERDAALEDRPAPVTIETPGVTDEDREWTIELEGFARDLAILVGKEGESLGRVYDEVGRMQRALAVAAPAGEAVVAVPVGELNRQRRALEELVAAPAPDVGLRMRYFEALMELARETRDEHVFDRIERLLEGGGTDG